MLIEHTPELGNTEALDTYFELILRLLKIVNAVVLSKGSENDQVTSLAQHFLEDHRSTIVAIFKRNAKIGAGAGEQNSKVLEEIVDNFTVLITAARFLSVCYAKILRN